MDCLGFELGTTIGLGARRAGPAMDNREFVLVEGFFDVDGIGIPDRALE